MSPIAPGVIRYPGCVNSWLTDSFVAAMNNEILLWNGEPGCYVAPLPDQTGLCIEDAFTNVFTKLEEMLQRRYTYGWHTYPYACGPIPPWGDPVYCQLGLLPVEYDGCTRDVTHYCEEILFWAKCLPPLLKINVDYSCSPLLPNIMKARVNGLPVGFNGDNCLRSVRYTSGSSSWSTCLNWGQPSLGFSYVTSGTYRNHWQVHMGWIEDRGLPQCAHFTGICGCYTWWVGSSNPCTPEGIYTLTDSFDTCGGNCLPSCLAIITGVTIEVRFLDHDFVT